MIKLLVIYAIALPIALAIFMPVAILQGWAISILWGWFIVPLFALPALDVVHAMALSMAVYLFTSTYQENKKGWEPFVYCIMRPLFAVAIGWVIKTYFM